MTVLVGGSVLLIAVSAIALFFGWVTAQEPLIWTSVGASVVAAILLALGYHRSREEVAAAAARAEPDPTASDGGRATETSARSETAEPTKPQPGVPDDDVVAVADRRRFHRSSCRYARVRGAERVSRAAARRRGYEPCPICKP